MLGTPVFDSGDMKAITWLDDVNTDARPDDRDKTSKFLDLPFPFEAVNGCSVEHTEVGHQVFPRIRSVH